MLAELLLNTIDRQSKPAVRFRSKRCLRARLSSNSCDVCLKHCHSRALDFDGGGIVFNEDRCTGCMGCVAECPNDAFSIEFDIQTLLRSFIDSASQLPLTISCKKAAPKKDGIRVPCIGLLSEPVLAGMNCVASGDLYLDVQACSDCENGHVLDLLHERVQRISVKSGGPEGLKIRYLSTEQDNRRKPEEQRRAFLNMARNSMVNIGRDASSLIVSSKKEGEKKSSSEKEAVRVLRFLQTALAQLPADKERERNLLLSYYYTQKAGADCNICPLCSGMCPTGALKRHNEDGVKQLNFTSSKCSGCGLCVEFCKKKALTLSQGNRNNPALAQVIASEGEETCLV